MMTERQKDVFESIDFYGRYESIVRQNTSGNRMENPDRGEVELLFASLNYKVKYFRSEKFYQVKSEVDNTKFILNFILRYGRVEPVFFAESKKSGLKIGSIAMRICKQLDLLRDVGKPKSLGAPTFSNYAELEKIFVQLLLVFEDFKSEVLLSGVLDNDI